MLPKHQLPFIFLICMVLVSCAMPAASTEVAPALSTLPATPAEPSGTVIEKNASEITLSHPEFNWAFTLPSDWVVQYDSGFQLIASNSDQSIFVRLQAQRWAAEAERPADASAYVEHWKNFSYGNVFPLFADGALVSETEVGADKFGGPYLQFEFNDSNKDLHYLQVYASDGGPSSALLSVWTKNSEYEKSQPVLQGILDSFQLVPESQ